MAFNAKKVDSVFVILQEYLEDGKINRSRFEKFKASYSVLHKAVTTRNRAGIGLDKTIKGLNQTLLAEKIKLERQNIARLEEDQAVSTLIRAKEQAKLRYQDAHQRATNLQFQLKENIQDQKMHKKRMERMKLANERLVGPQSDRLRKEIAKLEADLELKTVQSETENRKNKEISQEIAELRVEIKNLAVEEKTVSKKMRKTARNPERIRKQGDVIFKAIKGLEVKISKMHQSLGPTSATALELQRQNKQQNKIGAERGQVHTTIDVEKIRYSKRQREAMSLKKRMDGVQMLQNKEQQKRVELKLIEGQLKDDDKSKTQHVAHSKKVYEQSVRELKRANIKKLAVSSSIPNLGMQVNDLKHAFDHHSRDTQKARLRVGKLKRDVGMLQNDFLNKQDLNDDKKKRLKAIIHERHMMELTLERWRMEETEMAKLTTALSSQREMKAREATKSGHALKQAMHEVKIKNLLIGDLKSKRDATEARFREFLLLYEMVKSERNRYTSLAQSSSQAAAEMAEKIRILADEVTILRSQSDAKDKAINLELVAHANTCSSRDQLRLETNKSHSVYREKQEMVEQQIVEIDKFNNIINGMEDEMLKLKKQYEKAVENRNFMGLQLIERNDELCILYEQSNVFDSTRQKGAIKVKEKEEEIRMLKLEHKDILRSVQVSKTRLHLVPEQQQKERWLREQLASVREAARTLSQNLETPANSKRWKRMKGDDMSMDKLKRVAGDLQERIAEKKERTLEKELVLEEVTSLSTKLREYAAENRDEILKLAQKVNEFQSRIKDMSRRMMAAVSELSMYHATSMKLESEVSEQQDELEDALWRVENGEPPTEAAQHELLRLVQREAQRREALANRPMYDDRVEPNMVKRTTAEPRPNAYIPPNGVGIPKPYGMFAPMKPPVVGSTMMQHMRKPVEQEIVL